MYTTLRGLFLGTMTAWMVSLAAVSYADDTEIYFAKADVDNVENEPRANVMIMLDTSGSMRLCKTGSGQSWCPRVHERRINLLHDALEGIINNTPDSVNIGLGRFDAGTMSPDGGHVLVPVVPVNDKTKPYFEEAIRNINPQGKKPNPDSGQDVSPYGYTPTARAYAEMARYMLGLQADHSYSTIPTVTVCDQDGDPECKGFPRTVSAITSCTGRNCKGTYISPVNTSNQCETNHIILFTDGEPTEPEAVSLDGSVSCSSGK
jgi:type IV pilus assembly protein PilY1